MICRTGKAVVDGKVRNERHVLEACKKRMFVCVWEKSAVTCFNKQGRVSSRKERRPRTIHQSGRPRIECATA